MAICVLSLVGNLLLSIDPLFENVWKYYILKKTLVDSNIIHLGYIITNLGLRENIDYIEILNKIGPEIKLSIF